MTCTAAHLPSTDGAPTCCRSPHGSTDTGVGHECPGMLLTVRGSRLPESPMPRFFAAAIAFFVVLTPNSFAAQPDRRGLDLFEKKIRPVLVEHCYACHSQEAKKVRGELLLDTRDGLLTGGKSGAAIVPGAPAKSLLLKALRQT